MKFEGNYNTGHNILRLFYVWRNFLVTTSETNRDYWYKHGIYELPHELPTIKDFKS